MPTSLTCRTCLNICKSLVAMAPPTPKQTGARCRSTKFAKSISSACWKCAMAIASALRKCLELAAPAFTAFSNVPPGRWQPPPKALRSPPSWIFHYRLFQRRTPFHLVSALPPPHTRKAILFNWTALARLAARMQFPARGPRERKFTNQLDGVAFDRASRAAKRTEGSNRISHRGLRLRQVRPVSHGTNEDAQCQPDGLQFRSSYGSGKRHGAGASC